jgi:hypothetical protein
LELLQIRRGNCRWTSLPVLGIWAGQRGYYSVSKIESHKSNPMGPSRVATRHQGVYARIRATLRNHDCGAGQFCPPGADWFHGIDLRVVGA